MLFTIFTVCPERLNTSIFEKLALLLSKRISFLMGLGPILKFIKLSFFNPSLMVPQTHVKVKLTLDIKQAVVGNKNYYYFRLQCLGRLKIRFLLEFDINSLRFPNLDCALICN